MQNDTKAEVARLEARIDGIKDVMVEREKFAAAAAAAANRALDVALDAQKLVNQGQNEFRAQSKDFARELVERVEGRVSALERGAASGSGRSGGFATMKTDIAAVIGWVIAIISTYLLWKK